jgi:hypothetical protein
MTVLQVAGGERAGARDGASVENSAAQPFAQGAPEAYDGARNHPRGKLPEVAAVSIQRAIDLLDGGDVAGARSLLVAIVEAGDA